jgi:ketosteroid isomerase-like protein
MEVKTETKAEILDIPAELAKIEAMRKSFEQTVREKRYGDLGKFTTPDMISVGPGSADWIAYRKLREEHGNKFRYDSIIMKPKETVIVSDSIAYDFGVSSMYYTDENGTVHELEDTFLVILKRMNNGEWKLHRELASSLVE